MPVFYFSDVIEYFYLSFRVWIGARMCAREWGTWRQLCLDRPCDAAWIWRVLSNLVNAHPILKACRCPSRPRGWQGGGIRHKTGSWHAQFSIRSLQFTLVSRCLWRQLAHCCMARHEIATHGPLCRRLETWTLRTRLQLTARVVCKSRATLR